MAIASQIESSPEERGRGWAHLALGLGVGGAYYLAAMAAFWIGTFSDRVFAPFWPPNAVLFCALLLNSRSKWWFILLAAFPAHVIAEIGVGMEPLALLIAFATNAVLAVANAWMVGRFIGVTGLFVSVQKAIAYVVLTAGVNPALVGLLGAFVQIKSTTGLSQYIHAWADWYASNALADLTLAPAIISFATYRLPLLRKASPMRVAEAIVFYASLALATVASLVISDGFGAAAFIPVTFYLPFPIIMWGVIRFGSGAGSKAVVVLAVTSIWATLNNYGPFVGGSPESAVLGLQLFLAGVAVPTLLLSAALQQMRAAETRARGLVGSLLHAQDAERRRVARELHDGLGQGLAAALLMAGGTRQPAGDGSKLRELLKQLSTEIRTFSYLLLPPLLEQGGLLQAVPTYVEGFSTRTGVAVDLFIDPNVDRLPREMELALYRVIQEALTNICRHSGSATATVSLARKGPLARTAVLTISDYGVGIRSEPGELKELSVRPGRGVGLNSMSERMRQLGGELRIVSAPGLTTLTATLPLS